MSEQGIGALLAQLRKGLGLTQQQIADRYNAVEGRSAMTGKEIGRYERGVRTPTARTRQHLSVVLGVDPLVLDRATAVAKQRRREEDPADDGPSSTPGDAAGALWSLTGTFDAELRADACATAKFGRFIAARNTDETAVEQLEAEVATLARQYVSQPPAVLYTSIRSLRNETFDLLRGRQHPRQTIDLYVAAGRLCGLSAHVCLDSGDYASAMSHARTALICAETAGHNGLQSWVRAVQSLIAYWNDSLTAAAEFARAGRGHRTPGTIGVRLASLEARALAAAGDAQGAGEALAAAERERERVHSSDDMTGLFSFPTAKQFTYAGTTRLAMGGRRNVQRAVEAAGTAVELYRASDDDERSIGDLLAAHLDLARGHIIAGQVDAAEEMLAYVLDRSPGQLSASIKSRLRHLATELTRPHYRGSPTVAGLYERIRSATAAASPSPDDPRSRRDPSPGRP